MRIFTKKAFKFVNRESGASVRTEPLSFCDVPDWAAKDPIFALALKDNSIEVIESKQQQKQLENDPNAKGAVAAEKDDPEGVVSAQKDNAEGMAGVGQDSGESAADPEGKKKGAAAASASKK